MPRDCRRLGSFSSDSSSESVMLLKKYRLAIFLITRAFKATNSSPARQQNESRTTVAASIVCSSTETGNVEFVRFIFKSSAAQLFF